MIGKLELYKYDKTILHRADTRAKLFGLAGFTLGALLVPFQPYWPSISLLALLVATAIISRFPLRRAAPRLFGLVMIIGIPLLLSLYGSEETRSAGCSFAVKSFLVAGAFLTFGATTRVEEALDSLNRLPGARGLTALAGFILRGVGMLSDEVTRINRAWMLRAPAAGAKAKLEALFSSSLSLIGRTAVRSEKVGIAMVLRGFDGSMPSVRLSRLPNREAIVGFAYGTAAMLLGVFARW